MNRRSRMRAPNGFPTAGLFLATIHTGASRSIWPGVVDEAERQGLNLFCFPGGRLRAEDGTEAQRNAVYDLAGPECLDGLLTWASTLGGVLSVEEVDSFHARYRRLPMVSLSQPVAGAPTVVFDAYNGMSEAIRHLIQAHALKKIAFIRGPAAHRSAQERFRAYGDTLAAHGLPVQERLITAPLGWDSGEQAVRQLLDERGLKPGAEFQAVAAASDMLAFWALKGFQGRGLRIPADIAITGFNNTEESLLSMPPLTTVAIPLYRLGAQGLAALAGMLRGESVPPSLLLPSSLILRQSCGCPSAAVALAAAPFHGRTRAPEPGDDDPSRLAAADAAASASLDLEDRREEYLREMADAASLSEEAGSAWLAPLFEAFMDELKKPAGRFLATLDNVLDRAIMTDTEITPWQSAISVLRRRVTSGLPAARRAALEDLFSQARVMVAEAADRARTRRQWNADRLSESLRRIEMSLLTAFEADRVADVLAESLPKIGIPSAYLAVYEQPAEGTEYARLFLAYTEKGRVKLPRGGQLFPSRQLVPREHLPRNRRYAMVIEPLFFQEQQIGFAAFEIGPRNGSVYEELGGSISSALKGALLFREAREARAAAEKADTIKTRLLANVSHELRTPLNIILNRAMAALEGGAAAEDLAMIRDNAEHQLRVINDLLDLSRAEINELDLDMELLDPRPILEEVFRDFCGRPGREEGAVQWRLSVPERLPVIRGDAVRLRQILLNLLSNARNHTALGHIVLAAEVEPPCLHIRVEDTGSGITPELRERIFEPFVSAESGERSGRGIGLGLSIAYHITALHFGSLSVESEPGRGSVFHLRLPLPSLSDRTVRLQAGNEAVLVLVTNATQPPAEIDAFCKKNGLAVRFLRADSDWEAEIGASRPAALAWDLADAGPGERALIRRLRHHPGLFQAPVVLYMRTPGPPAPGSPLMIGMTGFLPKSSTKAGLMDFIDAACPSAPSGPVLVVDDRPEERSAAESLVRESLPGVPVRTAADGAEALRMMTRDPPCLVLLDLVMPGMDGLELLEKMRVDARLRAVPVVVLTHKIPDSEDLRRLEKHARVTLQSKGVWSGAETAAALHRSLFGTESLPPHTGALAKRAVVWLSANHAGDINRWQLAEAVGASEDYLSRIFHRELGLSPWEYLNRYRVHRAKELLESTEESMKAIAARVGFHDQAYFSRVFKKLAGISPQEYKRQTEHASPGAQT